MGIIETIGAVALCVTAILKFAADIIATVKAGKIQADNKLIDDIKLAAQAAEKIGRANNWTGAEKLKYVSDRFAQVDADQLAHIVNGVLDGVKSVASAVQSSSGQN